MPTDILDAMRALREDMRQRLLQSLEYRALETLDRSIDEISGILQETFAVVAPRPAATERPAVPPQAPHPQVAHSQALHPEPAPPAPARQNTIASAFAETLAAKIDQRNGLRASGVSLPAHRAHAG